MCSHSVSFYFPHDWPDAKCTAILFHLRDAMTKGYSRITINESVLLDTGAPWQQTGLDWTMMGMQVSQGRAKRHWHELLAKAGLQISGLWSQDSESMIEAVLADE